MKSFKQFFLEYRHNYADGTPAQSIQAHNGKDPNRVGPDKKFLHTVGPYKAKDQRVHRVGSVFSGNALTNLLVDYNLEFEDGKTKKIKNSPMGLQMYLDPNGQPIARVVQVKNEPAK